MVIKKRNIIFLSIGLSLFIIAIIAIIVSSNMKRKPDTYSGTILSFCENALFWRFGTTLDSKLSIKVDKKDFVIGRGSIKIEYNLVPGKSGAWMYCNVPVPVNKNYWSQYDTISFYLKGDGGENRIKIGLKDAEGELFLSQISFEMKDTKWMHYTLPLTIDEGGFYPNPYYQPNKDFLQNPFLLDLEGVQELQISVDDMWEAARSGWFKIDHIVLSKSSQNQGY